MKVYTSDKYYKDGINYFLISIGYDGKNTIYNIEIPSFYEIKVIKGETLQMISMKNEINICIMIQLFYYL